MICFVSISRLALQVGNLEREVAELRRLVSQAKSETPEKTNRRQNEGGSSGWVASVDGYSDEDMEVLEVSNASNDCRKLVPVVFFLSLLSFSLANTQITCSSFLSS